MFNGVVTNVLLLLEECFAIFRVKDGPNLGHGHVKKGSFACVFDEVNFLDHFLEKRAMWFWDDNAHCITCKCLVIGLPFGFHNFCCNRGECVTVPSAERGYCCVQ